ncbi:Uncharacterized conserved protein [Pseudomonas aeruginosa]|nr:Uncharacterized conserved protein [Pseudomonas aeruginosa]
MDDLSPDSALPPAGSAQDNDAPRQLVVCIDGTSNRFGDQPTNVVRLYRSLSRDPRRVLAYYDQGVGTFGLKETLFEWQKFPSRIAGLAFGWGLKRNVEGAYRFLAEHYRPGDQIFLFGFSRGAYAVRVLAAMLRAVGLIDAHQPHLFDYAWTLLTTRMPPRDEDKRAGTRRRGPDFGLLGRFRKVFGRQVKVHFLGLFDTVTSVGWVYDPLTVPYSSNNEMVDVVRQAWPSTNAAASSGRTSGSARRTASPTCCRCGSPACTPMSAAAMRRRTRGWPWWPLPGCSARRWRPACMSTRRAAATSCAHVRSRARTRPRRSCR